MNPPRIAFLGLGVMGAGMARRLLAANFPLTVYNRDPAKSAPLAAAGARVAESPRAAAKDADVVISMLADDEAARAVWLGKTGAVRGAPRGAVLIESSTVSMAWIEKLSAAAARRGCVLLDCPVTGSKPQAAAGELLFLAGGDAAALERVQPVLAAMGRKVEHVGPSGSGALLKLVNNFLCGVQTASLAEGLSIVERAGLDRAKALEILTTGSPGSPILRTFSARMAARTYEPNFLLRLMAKDLRYAKKEGARRQVPMTTATAALKVFEAAIAAGHGEQDVSSVIEPFRAAPPPSQSHE
jgi:3-hydroxyisobutyrate dehydrogenase